MSNKLSGKTVAFLVAAEGIEQVELTEPWQAVEQAGGTPRLVAPESGQAQAYYNLRRVLSDQRLAELEDERFEIGLVRFDFPVAGYPLVGHDPDDGILADDGHFQIDDFQRLSSRG